MIKSPTLTNQTESQQRFVGCDELLEDILEKQDQQDDEYYRIVYAEYERNQSLSEAP